jgi:hypothetical protein
VAAGERSVNFAVVAKDAASRVLKNINKSLKRTRGIAETVSSDLKKAGIAIAGFATGLAFFAAKAIQSAAVDQTSADRLTAALKTRKLATDSVTAAIEKQIEKARLLAFSGEDVRASVEASTRFTNKYAVAQKIQNIAMDLSRRTGMSLEQATIALGKAYQGNGAKLFTTLGITKKNLKGTAALNAIYVKTKGSADAYANTVEGSFAILQDSAKDLQKQIGFALLPAFTKLFKGLQPFIQRFSNYIKAATPSIQKFTDRLVTKFLAKLPGFIANAEEKLPSLFRQFGEFVKSIKGIGREADRVLGPGGAIRVAVTGIATAIGGLRGAIATNLLASGVDPIKAYFISTASAGILEGIIKGMTASLTSAAVTKFLALFKSVPLTVAPTVPVPGGAAAGAGWLASVGGIAGLGVVAAGVMAVGAVVAATAALSTAITDKKKVGLFNAGVAGGKANTGVIDIFGTTLATTLTPGISDRPSYAVGNLGTSYGAPEFKVYVGQKEFDATVRDALGRSMTTGGR